MHSTLLSSLSPSWPSSLDFLNSIFLGRHVGWSVSLSDVPTYLYLPSARFRSMWHYACGGGAFICLLVYAFWFFSGAKDQTGQAFYPSPQSALFPTFLEVNLQSSRLGGYRESRAAFFTAGFLPALNLSGVVWQGSVPFFPTHSRFLSNWI